MGTRRNGARTFLNLGQQMCQLSHLPGFRPGLARILGEAGAGDLLPVWDAFCAALELIIAADDHFNKVDATAPSEEGGEDVEGV